MLRFFLRHWAGILIVLFASLALLTGYQMWRAGPIGALSLLPQLAICLAVIVAVAVIRQITTKMRSSVARGAVREGLSQGQTLLKSKADEARGALSALGSEVKEDLEGLVYGERVPSASLLPRCPACNRYVRVGARFCAHCGVNLAAVCPRCGRPVRPTARFCDGCGQAIDTTP